MNQRKGTVEVTSVNHGEPWITRPYDGLRAGIATGIVTAIVLLIGGGHLVGTIVAGMVGVVVGAIAGVAMVIVGMSFPFEAAGYGREMGNPDARGPSLPYRIVGWLYLPVPVVFAAVAAILIARLLA